MGRKVVRDYEFYADYYGILAPPWMVFRKVRSRESFVLLCLHRWQSYTILRQVIAGEWRIGDRWDEECELVSKFIKKAIERSAVRVPGKVVAPDPKLVKNYPALCEFLTTEEDEGVKRQTATINLSWSSQDGFKGFLNDRETLQYLCVTSETLEGIFTLLNCRLVDDDPGWRQSAPAAKKSKKGT